MIRKTNIKYIYTYISFFTTSSATKTSQLKKKKKPTTVLTLKIENKNDSIKNQNNFFWVGQGGQRPSLDPPWLRLWLSSWPLWSRILFQLFKTFVSTCDRLQSLLTGRDLNGCYSIYMRLIMNYKHVFTWKSTSIESVSKQHR